MGTGSKGLRRWLWATLSVLTLLSVAACGGGAKPSAAPSDAKTPTTSQGTAAPAPAAAAKPPLKVGLLAPLSGVYASLGQNQKAGAELLFEEIGWQVAGRKVELIAEDDETNAEVGLRKWRKLVQQDKIDVALGTVGSNVTYAIRDDVDKSKVPLIAVTTVANGLTRDKKSPYIFRLASTAWQMSATMGDWLAKHGRKTAVVLSADYSAGRETGADFKQAFEAAGGKVIKEMYHPLGTNDYAAYLTEIATLKPDIIFTQNGGSDAVKLVQQWSSYGIRDKGIGLAATGFVLDNDVLPAQGKAAIGGLSALQWASTLDNATNKKFVESFRKKYNREPDMNAEGAYAAAKIIAEVLSKLDGNTTDKDALVKAIVASRVVAPRGTIVFDADTHQSVHTIYIREGKEVNGRVESVPIDKVENVRDPGK